METIIRVQNFLSYYDEVDEEVENSKGRWELSKRRGVNSNSGLFIQHTVMAPYYFRNYIYLFCNFK